MIFVVVGGGRIAREYIEKARALGASEMFCDTIKAFTKEEHDEMLERMRKAFRSER